MYMSLIVAYERDEQSYKTDENIYHQFDIGESSSTYAISNYSQSSGIYLQTLKLYL